MPDSYYDTQQMIEALKKEDMFQFDNMKLKMENESMTKEFSKSTIQKQEPLRQIESMDVCTTDIRKLVSTMLFLSHSKLAIKLRYILALYKIES